MAQDTAGTSKINADIDTDFHPSSIHAVPHLKAAVGSSLVVAPCSNIAAAKKQINSGWVEKPSLETVNLVIDANSKTQASVNKMYYQLYDR